VLVAYSESDAIFVTQERRIARVLDRRDLDRRDLDRRDLDRRDLDLELRLVAFRNDLRALRERDFERALLRRP
jgi:hypothetical protein